MCASKNDASPGTKRSLGTIRNTSPASESTNAITNHVRWSDRSGCNTIATATSTASVAGLAMYSSARLSDATAHQSATASTATSATRTHAVVVTHEVLASGHEDERHHPCDRGRPDGSLRGPS